MANAATASPKKSFKNRVKGFFSKIGSRFSRRKNATQSNKNFVRAADVQELNQQTQQLKDLLQRQIENAGELNMNNETKRVVQQNIETTRSLIEARQRELTDREEKEKLEALKKNIASVGNVVNRAPISNQPSNTNRAARRNLTRKAMNALNRMGSMNNVAAQIAEIKKVLEDCCEDGGMGKRGRVGSVSSVGTENREAANGAFAFAENEGWNEARDLAGRAVGNAAGNARGVPNFFEGKPKMRPNFFERPGVMPKRGEAEPSPAGLWGSNNFENEPVPSVEPGPNNFENEPEPEPAPAPVNSSPRGKLLSRLGLNSSATDKNIERAFRKASLNAHREGLRNSNTYKQLSGLYANWKNQMNPYEHDEAEPEPEVAPTPEPNVEVESNWREKLNALKAKGRNATDQEWQNIKPENLNNYRTWDMEYARWLTSKEGNFKRERAAALPRRIEGAKKRLVEYKGYLKNAKNQQERDEILEAIAQEEEFLKEHGVNLSTVYGVNNNNVSPAGLFGNNTFEAEPNVKKNNNNVSPAGLFGNNTFEAEPNVAPTKSLTMNNLTNNEKDRVRLMKELNNTITNNNALNMIRLEREQTARNLLKNYQKKRAASRSKRGKSYKGGKRRNVTRRR